MGIRTFLLHNLVSDSQSDSARWRCNLDSISDNLQNILAWDEDAVLGEQYTGPTRFIGGANSPYLMYVVLNILALTEQMTWTMDKCSIVIDAAAGQ